MTGCLPYLQAGKETRFLQGHDAKTPGGVQVRSDPARTLHSGKGPDAAMQPKQARWGRAGRRAVHGKSRTRVLWRATRRRAH